MDYIIACEIFDIIFCNSIKETNITISLKDLKKKYHKLALKHHPDKNGNTTESNKTFKQINEAYICIKREILEETDNNHIHNEEETHVYTDILQIFINSILDGNYTDIISKIIKDIVSGYKQVSINLFEGLDKDSILVLYLFLSTHKQILHLSNDILEEFKNILILKYENVFIYNLNPCINDLLNNKIYKLPIKEEICLVPLWHNESYFDVAGCEIIVICEPELPENITIDDDNNIFIDTQILITDLHILIRNNCDLDVSIGEQIFKIPICELRLKREQLYRIKNNGLSKFKNDVYDISEKADIIFKITLK